MDALVIGGTGFVGRHLVEALLEGGHKVTLLNRGQTNPGVYPAAEKIQGDRDSDLAGLNGRDWDVVFDINGYLPRLVQKSVDKLRDHVQRYVYLSSTSVYTEDFNNTDETSGPVQILQDRTVEEITGATYGGLKILCEQAVMQAFGDRGLVVRPGLIVGRYDYIARLPYLVRLFKRGGERLAGRPEQPIQMIHGRDLGDWMLQAAQQGLTGAYNLTGQPIRMSALFDSLNRHTGNHNTITYVGDAFILEHSLAPIDGLTFWIPESYDRLMHVTIEKALGAGLKLRSVDAIVQDVVDWDKPENILTDPLGGSPDSYLLKPEREAELLAEWHNRAKAT